MLCESRKKFGFAKTFTFSREGVWKKEVPLLLNSVLNKQTNKQTNKEKTSGFQFYQNFHHLTKFNLETCMSTGNFRI